MGTIYGYIAISDFPTSFRSHANISSKLSKIFWTLVQLLEVYFKSLCGTRTDIRPLSSIERFLSIVLHSFSLVYSLDSAGEGGFSVSGLMQSDGEGDRSRFVVMCPRPSDRPAAWLSESERWPRPPECPRWVPGNPSGMLFSDKNSSRSAYCKRISQL